ncbi:replication initiation protein, partial [uncultured Clostridium sp.]|uniref:replication initiation protein n=1 Tax=uncultured Clostridium sp. TaxID=59620 RepID=UPI002636C5FB
NKLIEASYSFTVLEQKIVRLLASIIKKNDDDFKEYQFKATDLSKILNINQKNIYMELDKITDKLMGRYIKIKSDDSEKFKKRHLIKIADFENGVLTIKIDEDMKDFYLKLNWYTKYQLKNIMQFKSTYSFRLYELLKQYQKIGNRLISISDLRTILDINANQYPKYANLKQKVIRIAIDEINVNTDLSIDFKEFKEVRKVTSIKFYIKQNNETIREIAATKEIEESLQEVGPIKQVQDIFIKHTITPHEASCILKDANNNINLIAQCYTYLLSKDVKNITGYMRTIVKNFTVPKENIKTDSFNDYEQREYDFKSLERKLLGWDNEK